jgi:hypothetical protein
MQSSVGNTFQSSGVPGEFSRSENQDSFGAKLNSDSEALNKVGSVVLHVDGDNNQVGVAADGNFAGILCNPKASIRPTLDAQAFLSNATQCEVATRGYLWVTLAAAADTGDFVYYNDTTGVLSTLAPATVPGAGVTRLPGGKVVGDNVTAAGTAEIYFDTAGSTETPVAP